MGFGTARILGQSIPERHPNVLSLGTVTVLGSVTCPGGATKGATCTSGNVSCPAIPDLTATLAEALPTGTAKGTVILVSGSGGTAFLNSGFGSAYIGDDSVLCNSPGPLTGRTPAASA